MILQAERIYKSYGNLQVLKGINMRINKGEIISIVGASGAGKSTLLHILGTLDRPDSGLVNINNINVINMRSNVLAKFRNKYIGFVFQFHNLLPEFSAFENVCLPGYIAKLNQRQVENEAHRLLDMLGLSQRKNHKPSELSG
ncbi:MAG: ABC transporter ATP-binding protein, partial [Cyclobacteriaceae bacterium]